MSRERAWPAAKVGSFDSTAEIEGVAWFGGLTFTAYGCRIGVRVNDPDSLRLLPNYLPYGWRRSGCTSVEKLYCLSVHPGRHGRHILSDERGQLACSRKLPEVLEALEREARLYVAEHARRRVFIHAAAVGWRGRAIVIPGRSMSGKTSLAAEFVRAGATYYSDEYTVLDERGLVHPYAKALSIRSVEDGYRQTDYPVETFGGRPGSRPIPVGLVLLTRYRAGVKWRPRPVSRGTAALALLANAIAARNRPEQALDVVRKSLQTASVLNGCRGESSQLVESVLGCYGPEWQ